MFDNHHIGHSHSENWGILPSLNIFGIHISSYSFFVLLGLIVGILVFWYLRKGKYEKNENSFFVIFAGIFGGILGAKIPIWIAYFDEIKKSGSLEAILSGRTITGGIIGGFLAVILTKKMLGEKSRFGNDIAPAVAIGIAIGRIGCFLHGCCFGQETNLAWGVDFGDGMSRHPTQIYEIIFLIILTSFLLIKRKNKNLKEGILFDYFLLFYFFYRFCVEFIRVEPKVFYDFTAYQIVSVVVVIFVLIKKNLGNKFIVSK